MAELELKKQKRELIPVETIAPAVASMIERTRSRLLAIPVRLTPRLATAKNAVEAEALIKAEIDAALTELAQPDVSSC